MPKFAFFNSAAAAPSLVLGWYDTDDFAYASLPSPADLLAVTDAQWAARLSNPSGWAVSGGALAPYVPPAPVLTLAQQAALAIAAGLTLTLSGTLTLAATLFPTDAVTQQKLAAVATTINATGGFPGGSSTYPMKDATGAWHSFTVAQYKAVAASIGAYVSALTLIADGNPLGATALPAASVSISV